VVATRGNAGLTLDSVQEDARKYIAGYKLPRELHIVDEVPRAPSGKPAYPKALEIALGGEHKVA
jgi:acyl-CoA synthetase (AMP-forming)/AMP-acid ligase II